MDEIGSDKTIEIAEGRYNLSEVATDRLGYDEDYHINYESCYDGVQISLNEIKNLTIRGAEGKRVELVIEPRYAEVFQFYDCNNITLENVVMGHTGERGSCEGDVLQFEDCNNISLHNVDLYGCGTFGISLYTCNNVSLNDSIIRECSYGIVEIRNSNNVSLSNCDTYDNDGFTMLDISSSSVSFTNCSFSNNEPYWDFLPKAGNSNYISFTGCYFGSIESVKIENNDGEAAFNDCTFDTSFSKKNKDIVEVASEKEFLDAIESDTVIKVVSGIYNLSNYVENVDIDEFNSKHKNVKLADVYDGVSIEIHNVDNLSITSESGLSDSVEIKIDPRYADVLYFENCSGLSFESMTMGHTNTGECIGSVLRFNNCSNMYMRNMDLYGCGVYAIEAAECDTLRVMNSTLRDCSYGPYCIECVSGSILFKECKMIDSKGCGSFYECEKPIKFQGCTFGKKESELPEFYENIILEGCKLEEVQIDSY